jgi:hypothetical protein
MASAGRKLAKRPHMGWEIAAPMSGRASRFDQPAYSLYVLTMAAANASARGQRVAILTSPLRELTGLYLAVDCLAAGCNGVRTFAITELAGC